MTWIDPIQVTWRGIQFDSTLEADWCASLTVWDVDWLFHPGSITLSDGREWQPDFLLRNAGEWGQDLLLEVKGSHDKNLDKAHLCQADNPDKTILVGRSPYVSGEDLGEYAGAVWEPSDYVWDLNSDGESYVSAERAEEGKPGLTFYKALANTNYVR